MQWKRVERRRAASAVRSTFGRTPTADLTGAASGSATHAAAAVQPLEPRTLFSVSLSFETLVNASKNPFNQSETAIAINPTNPNNVFMSSNHGAFVVADQGPNDPIAETGIFTSVTTNGGATWTTMVIATDNDGNDISDDGFPIACCDPSAAFDDFGNLFYAYLAFPGNTGDTSIVVLMSTDGGFNFTKVIEYRGGGADPQNPTDNRGGNVDRCEITTARLPDGSTGIALTFVDFNPSVDAMQCATATATGLGVVGPWTLHTLPQSGVGAGDGFAANVGDPGIGPDGQVLVAYQTVGDPDGEAVYENSTPNGFAPGAAFGNAVFVDDTQVGTKEPLPGQPARGLSAVATVDYDRSSGPHRGRVYMVYTQQDTKTRRDDFGFPLGISSDTNVFLRFSDDNGGSWSAPFRVNDDPVSSTASQFFQRVRVDPITGNVAVGWMDTRDDPGGGAPADEAGYYLTVGQPAGNGIQFAPNIRLNVGLSNARLSGNFGNDYGDYTGLDFYNNLIWAAYPDNSNSTGDNPSGKLRAFDIYAAAVRVTDTTTPIPPFVTPASPLSPTVSKPQSLVKKGKFYQLKVTYSHPSGVNLATVGNDDVVVTGPNGFNQPMTLARAKAKKKGTVVQATYRLAAPGGSWDAADNAVYTAILQPGAVASNDNTAVTASGTLTNFLVNAKPAKTKQSKAEPPAAAAAVAAPVSPFNDDSLVSKRKQDEALSVLA
jgi:hypothetical protein